MSNSKNSTEIMLSNYNQFLVSIETNIANDSQKRKELLERIEEMY